MPNTLFEIPRSAHETAADYRERIGRVGGLWRPPNYLRSYAKASSLLLQAAHEEQCYDDIALPLFYLQRHTVELAIKDVLHVLIDISEMEQILKAPKDAVSPTNLRGNDEPIRRHTISQNSHPERDADSA